MTDGQLLTIDDNEHLKALAEEILKLIGGAGLKPYAVTVKEACRLQGGKAHSQFYVEAGRGEYELIKDGSKTLVTVRSIEQRLARLPRAAVKSPPHRRGRG